MPGPERRLTLLAVTPGAPSASYVAMIGTSAITWRITDHSCDARHRQVPMPGHHSAPRRLRPRTDRTFIEPNAQPPPREDHCTLPRALPPGMLQEQPVPTGAELVKTQVLAWVTQYPPAADATGV